MGLVQCLSPLPNELWAVTQALYPVLNNLLQRVLIAHLVLSVSTYVAITFDDDEIIA